MPDDIVTLLLEGLYFGGAILAALFWAASALVRVPDMPETSIGGEKSVTTFMARQSKLSAIAAIFAAASAFAQIAIRLHS